MTTQLKISDVLRGTFTLIAKDIQALYARIPIKTVEDKTTPNNIELERALHQIEIRIKLNFAKSKYEVLFLYEQLRRHAYLLAYTGEAEAIGRTLNSHGKVHITKQDLDSLYTEDSYAGGSTASRITLILKKLEQRLLNAVHLSAIRGESSQDMMKRVLRVLPPSKTMTKPQRVLKKPIVEADRKNPAVDPDKMVGFVDEQEWQDMLDAYHDEFVPKWRGPDAEFNIGATGSSGETKVYAWEMEQILTQDFVYQVRLGQVDASKENGIIDFVWIAVLDDKTDDCCEWRDGLLTSEIDQQLKSSHKDDDCVAIVPPAHFNCRCTLAPATENLPEQEPSNYGEFDEWLNNTGTTS